ncbi:uncharacterized protein NPIL_626631 [Nephila pilipes]|uniref:Uncharacterized protein n=1 Tax=Nephila pilipes TaxID=299642 RepID=A0A8X6NFJ9_NEPPI|nr:uncharacterized protein NPIL_626631 [Nephila pilipes]
MRIFTASSTENCKHFNIEGKCSRLGNKVLALFETRKRQLELCLGKNLRQRLFRSNERCNFYQYRCLNNDCIERTQLCNGRYDCTDNSDEGFCDYSGYCPDHRAFMCHNHQRKCIPLNWICDGILDCYDGADENDCNDKKGNFNVKQEFIFKSMVSAQNWIRLLRKSEYSVRRWGSDVERIAVALFLSNETVFIENDAVRNEFAYESSLSLLSRLALKKIEDVSSTELASYVNAFIVTCIDPRKFYVIDLVRELRKRADATNYTNPYVMLALCNAGERITVQDTEKLISVFWRASREFWKDVQALAVLALACASKQPHKVLDMEEISELTMELKKMQYRNGTVENIKTTALVMQALFASETEADEDHFDEEKALKQILLAQKDDGSFGNFMNTYYVLPVLNYRSLVNISSSHCKTPLINETEALKELMNQVGEKWSIKFSLWIGNNRTIERTLTLNVPANISFYRIMEFAANVDKKYRFEYNVRNGKPYIYSISEIQEDPENGMMWLLFTTTSDSEGDVTQIMKSPADVVPKNKQHLVFWYKCAAWTQ